MKFVKVFLTSIVLIVMSICAYSADNLTDVKIVEIDIRVSSSYALIKLDKTFTACNERSFVKLPLNDSAASKAAFSTVLAAKASNSKVNILSSETCDHFNVLERIKIL